MFPFLFKFLVPICLLEMSLGLTFRCCSFLHKFRTKKREVDIVNVVSTTELWYNIRKNFCQWLYNLPLRLCPEMWILFQTNVETIFLISVECPPLPQPRNGIKSCNKLSGKILCKMACNEGHSFNSEAITTYGCGPDTDWKWNSMAYFTVPVCSSMLNLDSTYTSDR